MEERCLRPCQAMEPPHGIDHSLREKLLYRPNRREVCPNLVPKVLEGVGVLAWKNDVTGEEPMPESIEADHGLPLRRLWSRGAARVRLVRGLLSFARHGFPAFTFADTA